LLSNSDAHSLEKLGREATLFSIDAASAYSYRDIVGAIAKKNSDRVAETIEFFPEEGKYHVDGHAACNFSCAPHETKKCGGICPKCGKQLTIGVLNRVEALADVETEKVIHSLHAPFRSIIPLVELVAFSIGTSVTSKKVVAMYDRMIEKIGTEFYILLDAPIEKISAMAGAEIAETIASMRLNNIKLTPGYDGVFGKIEIVKKQLAVKQQSLL